MNKIVWQCTILPYAIIRCIIILLHTKRNKYILKENIKLPFFLLFNSVFIFLRVKGDNIGFDNIFCLFYLNWKQCVVLNIMFNKLRWEIDMQIGIRFFRNAWKHHIWNINRILQMKGYFGRNFEQLLIVRITL